MSGKNYKKVPVLEIQNEIFENPPKYGYGIRHIQGLLIFLCLSICYMVRGHLGVSIVAMTDKNSTRRNDTAQGINTLDLSEYNISVAAHSWTIYRTYIWPKSTQEMVLGSFFLGYSAMMFPAGIIGQKFGGKLLLQVALGFNAILSILTPWIVAWGDWKALCACRVIQGATQSGVYPGIQTLLSNWVPISERGSFNGFVYTGSAFGTVLAFQFGGILSHSHFGWPSMFWLAGAACFVLFLLITIFSAPYPAAHKSLSTEEKNYIIGDLETKVHTKPVTPWKSILMSVPAWSTFCTHAGSTVSFVFMYIQIPTYMNSVMNVNIRNNGILSSLPYIALLLSSILFGYLSDFLTNRKILSPKNNRKLLNSISTVIPGICVVAVSYTKDTLLAAICFIVTQASHSAVNTGYMLNYMDLSPNYSGALMAFGNTLANVCVLALPVLISFIVVDVTNQYQWRIMMYIISATSIAANFVFVIFMSAEVQLWNKDVEKKQSEQEGEELEAVKEPLRLNYKPKYCSNKTS